MPDPGAVWLVTSLMLQRLFARRAGLQYERLCTEAQIVRSLYGLAFGVTFGAVFNGRRARQLQMKSFHFLGACNRWTEVASCWSTWLRRLGCFVRFIGQRDPYPCHGKKFQLQGYGWKAVSYFYAVSSVRPIPSYSFQRHLLRFIADPSG